MENALHKYRYEIGLIVLWVFVIFIINPIGNFPINDDWAFAKNVESLVNGELFFHEWAPMTLIVQTLWGAAFCKIFGFSYTVLRISTLVLGGIGIIYMYKTIRVLGNGTFIAILAALLLAINPFYIQNAFSYMTEVPFVSLLIVGLYHTIRYLLSPSVSSFILLILFSILAVMIRQIGILLPLAFLVVTVYESIRIRNWSLVLRGFIPLLCTVLSLVVYTYWREWAVGYLPHTFGHTSVLLDNVANGELTKITRIGHSYWAMWGIFTLPFLIIILPTFFSKSSVWLRISAVFTGLFFVYIFIEQTHAIQIGNTLQNINVGVLLLPDWSGSSLTRLNTNDWENILITSLASGGALLGIVQFWVLVAFRGFKHQEYVNLPKLLASVAIVGYFVFLMMHQYVFDRYSVVGVPFVLILLCPTSSFSGSKVFSSLGVIAFVLLAFFSIAATHDYMSWSRAWYDGIRHAQIELEITPKELQESTEYPGNYSYYDKTNKNYTDQIGLYIFSFSKHSTFQTIDSFLYKRYLPPSTDHIYLLRELPLGDTTTSTHP